jgi:hypothetical protein
MHQVNRAAQKTDAQQLTRNLLLTKNATVNVKPNLQIVADDVKCTHGCTVRARVGRSATTTHLTHRPPLLGAPNDCWAGPRHLERHLRRLAVRYRHRHRVHRPGLRARVCERPFRLTRSCLACHVLKLVFDEDCNTSGVPLPRYTQRTQSSSRPGGNKRIALGFASTRTTQVWGIGGESETSVCEPDACQRLASATAPPPFPPLRINNSRKNGGEPQGIPRGW